jgi:AcrR family transcriptional regulator
MANTVTAVAESEYTRTLLLVPENELVPSHATQSDTTASAAVSRAERKEQTRAALLDATLELLQDRTFASLSLREVARAAGIVPTAFYRHFESMDELGVALVENATRPLREMIREARTGSSGNAIVDSVDLLARTVRQHEADFRFVIRERNGAPAIARSINSELQSFAHELVVDLARIPALRSWSAEDLEMVADLMINATLGVMQQLVEIPASDLAAEKAVRKRAEKQLRLVVLGIAGWRPNPR